MYVTTITPRYKLLKPVNTDPGPVNIYNSVLKIDQLEKYILTPASRDLCAVDLETKGVSPFYKHTYKNEEHESKIMGIGFAWNNNEYKSAYINWNKQPDDVRRYILTRLQEMYLVAHNAMFDGLWLRHEAKQLGLDVKPNWVADTFGYYKQLAAQDFKEQKHGLKDAQVNLLGWDEKGDIELDEWLINKGYYTVSNKTKEKRAVKGEMWRVPTNILGKYCGLDCIATLQLFDMVFEPVIKKHPHYWDYHDKTFIRTISELIEQQIDGTPVALDKAEEGIQSCKADVVKYEEEFFKIESIQPFLEEWREIQIAKPTKKKDGKITSQWEEYTEILEADITREERIEKLKEFTVKRAPTQHKKDGTVSKNYLKYLEKVEEKRKDPRYLFNPGSGDQLKWLFYDRMYAAEKKVIEYNKREIVCYDLDSPRGKILLPATDSEGPPTDSKALPWLGEAGDILKKRNKAHKTLTMFLEPYVNFATTSNDGRMHPGFMVPQAVTGRLGGSKPNMQQISGDTRVLKALPADPGYVIVERDWASLEDYVAANYTNCPGLLSIYGPNAKPNDGHLWLGSQLPVIGEAIRNAGYDIANPTAEMIAHVKKVCSHERDITKGVKYSATYGIGAFKLWQDFMANGINVSLEDTATILKGYWDVFTGISDMKQSLMYEWKRNKGWISNAVGRTMSVGEHHLKDLFSRSVQGGGHDLQMEFGMNVADAVKEHGLDAKPYIFDLHDATYWQVREEQLEDYLKISEEAAEKVWIRCKKELGWTCRLTTSAKYGKTMAELKGVA